VQHWKCWPVKFVPGIPLGLPQSTPDVELTRRCSGASPEHEIGRLYEAGRESLADEDHGELAWDRHGARRAVSLRRLSTPLAVDLPGEADLGLVQVLEPHVRPSERQELGDPGTGERRYADMPKLVRDLGQGRVKLWLRPELDAWANQRRRNRGRPRRGR